MGFRPFNPLGGGSGGRQNVLVSGSPFADEAALEVWAQANPTLLINSETQVSVAFVNGQLWEYQGVTGVYASGQWADITPDGLTPEMIDDINSIGALTNRKVPMGSPNGLVDSIASQPDDSAVIFDGEIGTTRTTVRVGDNLTLGEDGAAAVLSDMIDNIRALPAGTLLNDDGSTGVNIVLRRDQLQEQVLQSLDNETQTGNWTAWVPVTADRIISKIRVRFAQEATGVRFTIRQADNQTQTDGPVLYRSHTDTVWNDGGGFSVTADPVGGPGSYEVNLENSAKVLLGKFVYVVVEQNTQGTGDIEFRGATIDIAGATQFYAYLEQTFLIETRDELALKSDISEPLGYATITNLERIDNNWESFGKVQLDNILSQVNDIDVAVIKTQNNASSHDFRIVYGGTNASHAGEVYYTGNLTSSVAGSYIISLAATVTAIPSESSVVLEAQAVQVSGSRVDHQSTMITYQERV